MHLTRRQFLGASAASGAALALTQTGLGAAGGLLTGVAGGALGTAVASASSAPGPLVICTLLGGNDGLNTVVPYEEGVYLGSRGSLAIGADQTLPIGSFDGVALGLHPSLTGMAKLWAAGQLAVICGVEYPDPSFSHFQSSAIWQSASVSGDHTTGWIGRWLDRTGTDPLRAIGVGSTLQPALVGARQQGSTVADDTSASAQQPWQGSEFMGIYDRLMSTPRGRDRLADLVAASGTAMVHVGQAASAAIGTQKPPADPTGRAGDLGTQLGVVAELVKGGLPTQVYSTALGSFDTHANQAWTHQYMLGQVDAAVSDFVGAFQGGGAAPVVMVHSEFGRTLRANASAGTDHGSASVVLVAGPGVRGGFYGAVPSFTALDPYGNLVYTTDFRSVYATLLESVLGFDSAAVLDGTYPTLGFV